MNFVFGHISVANEGIFVKFGAHTLQILPYGGASKITFFVKFIMVAICTKFGTSIQNKMPMTIRK